MFQAEISEVVCNSLKLTAGVYLIRSQNLQNWSIYPFVRDF